MEKVISLVQKKSKKNKGFYYENTCGSVTFPKLRIYKTYFGEEICTTKPTLKVVK